MVAMAVMAFGLLGFMFMQGQAAQGRTAGREMGRATVVAQNYNETLRALKYNNSLLSIGSHPSASEDTSDGTVDSKLSTKYGNFIYDTTWTVTNNKTNNLKTIVVNTKWQLKDNQLGIQTKNLNFTLLKSK